MYSDGDDMYQTEHFSSTVCVLRLISGKALVVAHG